MEFNAELWALIFVIVIILLMLVGIVYAIVSKNMRKGSSLNSVTFFGATSHFQNVEQKSAVEHILDIQADKKMDEEESGDPDKK